jgi:hypothetical protein
MIPTSIDGTDITGATIDGTDVTEITVDGQTVFTAGGPIAQYAYVNERGADLHIYEDSTGAGDWDFSSPDRIATNVSQVGVYLIPDENDKRFFQIDTVDSVQSADILEFSYSDRLLTSTTQIQSHNFVNGSFDNVGDGIEFSADGKTLFLTLDLFGAGDEVEVWDLTTPFDISSSSRISFSTVGGFDNGGGHMGPIKFNEDGTRVYHGTRGGEDHVSQFDLSTPFDLSSKGSASRFTTNHDDPMCVFWNQDGSSFYTYHHSPDMIDKHDCNTAFDITTVSNTTEVRSDGPFSSSGFVSVFKERQF